LKNTTPEAAELKRERQQQAARDGAEAMAQYEAQARATREKTERLRSLRLARDAAAAAAPAPAKKSPAKKSSARRAGN
jgi:hypothetical protein